MTSSFWICIEITCCVSFFKSYIPFSESYKILCYFSLRLLTFQKGYTMCNFYLNFGRKHISNTFRDTLWGGVIDFVLSCHLKAERPMITMCQFICRGMLYVAETMSTRLDWRAFFPIAINSPYKFGKFCIFPRRTPRTLAEKNCSRRYGKCSCVIPP